MLSRRATLGFVLAVPPALGLCGGCHAAPAPVAPLGAEEAPAPARAEPPALGPSGAAQPRAKCAQGYELSTEFVQKPWLGAYDVVKAASNVWVDDDDPTTAEAARDGLCLQTSGIVGMPPNLKSTCKGEYWVITTDHEYYTDHTFVIVPRGVEAIVFDAGLLGGGVCTGEQGSTVSSAEVGLNGHFLRILLRSESHEWSSAANPGEECQRSHTDVADYTYDLQTGVGCQALHVE